MKVLGVILLGCALLLPATCSAAAIEKQEELFEMADDLLYDLQELAGGADLGEQTETSSSIIGSEVEEKRWHETHGNGGGTVYIRWGRTTCPRNINTVLVYKGMAGGSLYREGGGGSNYVCLPNNPEWGDYRDGLQGTSYMHGAEYQVELGNNPFQDSSLHDHDVPCAVCHVASRGSKLMIPARLSCPNGWTREYKGYLMAERFNHHRSEFVCMDWNPEKRASGHLNRDGMLFYPVEAVCGSLACPNYVNGRELTCVVCTK